MHEFAPSRASAGCTAGPARRTSREHDSSNRGRTGQAPDPADHVLLRRHQTRRKTFTGFPTYECRAARAREVGRGSGDRWCYRWRTDTWPRDCRAPTPPRLGGPGPGGGRPGRSLTGRRRARAWRGRSMIACQGRGQLDLLDAFVGDREGNGLCGQHGVGHRVLLGLVVTPGGKRSWLRYWRRAPLAHGSAHGGLSPILA